MAADISCKWKLIKAHNQTLPRNVFEAIGEGMASCSVVIAVIQFNSWNGHTENSPLSPYNNIQSSSSLVGVAQPPNPGLPECKPSLAVFPSALESFLPRGSLPQSWLKFARKQLTS